MNEKPGTPCIYTSISQNKSQWTTHRIVTPCNLHLVHLFLPPFTHFLDIHLSRYKLELVPRSLWDDKCPFVQVNYLRKISPARRRNLQLVIKTSKKLLCGSSKRMIVMLVMQTIFHWICRMSRSLLVTQVYWRVKILRIQMMKQKKIIPKKLENMFMPRTD